MTDRRNYSVHARHGDKWWVLDVPEVEGAFTQVKRLSQAQEMAREVIALVLDVPEDSFDVTVVPDLGDEAEAVLRDLAEARNELARAVQHSNTAIRQAADQLTHHQGLTVRDAGEVLGVSYQRVAQLTGTGSGQS